MKSAALSPNKSDPNNQHNQLAFFLKSEYENAAAVKVAHEVTQSCCTSQVVWASDNQGAITLHS